VIHELSSLPGCSQICVSHAVFVPKELRGTGVGSKAHQKRLELMKDLGYDLVVCTVDQSNIAQMSIMSKFGWIQVTSFISTKTEHIVCLFVKHLKEV